LFGNPSSTPGVQRWGDYSGTTTICRMTPFVTCAFSSEFFGVNEKIDNPGQTVVGDSWGSDIYHVTSP
jgi:hypothetical protein